MHYLIKNTNNHNNNIFICYFDKLFILGKTEICNAEKQKSSPSKKILNHFFFLELTDITKLSEPPHAAITLCLRF